MSDLQKYKKKQLQDSEFKAEYERTRPEYEIMRALVDARISQNLTQKELADFLLEQGYEITQFEKEYQISKT